jgi:hypothetical protein
LPLLFQAKFAYNNTTHASTGISSFFANYGFHPRFSLEILGDSINPSVEERAKRLGQVQQDLMAEFKLTQEWQKKQAANATTIQTSRLETRSGFSEKTLLPLAHVLSWITSALDLSKSLNLSV